MSGSEMPTFEDIGADIEDATHNAQSNEIAKVEAKAAVVESDNPDAPLPEFFDTAWPIRERVLAMPKPPDWDEMSPDARYFYRGLPVDIQEELLDPETREAVQKEREKFLAAYARGEFPSERPQNEYENYAREEGPVRYWRAGGETGEIGEGGMARVYKAWDAKMERWVGIKVMKSKDAKSPVTSYAVRQAVTLEKEAKNMARINHPGVVRVLDFQYVDEAFYAKGVEGPAIVMEYLDPRENPTLEKFMNVSSGGAEPEIIEFAKEYGSSFDADQIARKIRLLDKSELYQGIEKLQGYRNIYRIRIGNFRIVYKKTKTEIYIILISHRKDIYKLVERILR